MRAVIVGSGGIGSALASELVSSGAQVHVLSRRAEGPPGARVGYVDLMNETSIAEAASHIGETGSVDLVIVATGLLHDREVAPEKSFRDLGADQLASYFAINSIGPAILAKHFLPLLPRRGRSVFAALSARVGSIADNRLGGWHGYRASKAALNMLVKTLAIELARTRPDAMCVALHPGTVDTGLSRPFQRSVEASKLFTPHFAARSLLSVVDQLTPADSGNCIDWSGQRVMP